MISYNDDYVNGAVEAYRLGTTHIISYEKSAYVLIVSGYLEDVLYSSLCQSPLSQKLSLEPCECPLIIRLDAGVIPSPD